MHLEDRLLIGGLLMAIALFSATHAHARVHSAAAPSTRVIITPRSGRALMPSRPPPGRHAHCMAWL